MTARIPGWHQATLGGAQAAAAVDEFSSGASDGRVGVTASVLEDPVRLTIGMVDEAVANVVRARDIPADQAAVLKGALGRDISSGPMQAYYTAKAAATREKLVGVGRKDVVIPYVLDDQNVQDLAEYAPEYRFKFHNVNNHDHSMAAATRLIDNKIIFSRLPVGVPFSDIGGNPMSYIKAGRTGWHVCGPTVDVKDPMRHKLRAMEARKMSSGHGVEARLASEFLAGDQTLSCGKRAQDCGHKSPIGIAVHVYDIPMRDWPSIMDNKGLSLVEGCLLFSPRFFEESMGELGVSRARFEIDVTADKFRMGFSQSPSWWYEHKFSDYLLYGTDQLMQGETCSYSYKIVEKRGDTVFFRILRVPTPVSGTPSTATYKRPGVKMVQVRGFKLANAKLKYRRPSLDRELYTFPANLWGEMVAQAAEDFERGVMDVTKMYNHYRTISVRHTINAVLVMGGEQVSADELVPLVVHACLAAAAQSMMGQRVTRGITDVAMRNRSSATESTWKKFSSALSSFAKSALLAPLYPLTLLGEKIKDVEFGCMEQWVLDWEPLASFVTVDVDTLKVAGGTWGAAMLAESLVKKKAIDSAPFDHYAAVVADPRLLAAVRKMCPTIDIPDPVGDDEPNDQGCGAESISPPPSYVTKASGQAGAEESKTTTEEAVRRIAAIREHIEEAKLQNRALAFTCAEAYGGLSIRGQPNLPSLKKKAELYRNPDFWRVQNGVLVESILGVSPESFNHSAVYNPRADPETGSTVRAVFRSDWTGMNSSGVMVTNKNFVIADSEFSGWVLVTDDLLIYNGPEIIGAMQKALALPHDYSVKLNWGPPGCGKTYSILQKFKPDETDVVMCPVRESIEDTRGELINKYPQFNAPRKYVRTVDSYLVNLAVDKKTAAVRADRLLADECFMTHAGKWYAVAALLGVSEMEAWGDDEQILHIPRVQAPKLHVKLACQEISKVWLVRRGPATAVAMWGGVYNWRVRTLSKKVGSAQEVRSTKGRSIPDGCVMMCMYQADKRELRKLYAADIKRVRIMTAHESEGKTFAHVWLHRFDLRKRTDGMSLFDQQRHVLVAASRHTDTFVYCCPAPLGDLVSTWVARAQDSRRIEAARDVDSAGIPMEKL